MLTKIREEVQAIVGNTLLTEQIMHLIAKLQAQWQEKAGVEECKHDLKEISLRKLMVRHKKTGCGSFLTMALTDEDIQQLKDTLSFAGIDIEITEDNR